MMFKQAKPSSRKYSDIIYGIKKDNTLKLPKFQRDFIWELEKTTSLLESVIKGYPIGTFIIWKTKEKLAHIKNIGELKLDDPTDDQFIEYVLDGQQRITSLFLAGEGISITKNQKNYDYKNIYVDLTKSYNDENLVSAEKPSGTHITIHDLLNKDFEFLASFDKIYHKKISAYQNQIKTYDFSVIEIDNYPIDIVVDIFNKINTTGKSLSTFEIMVAKTYDESKFDLYDKYEILKKELEDESYNIPSAQLLQCISMNLVNECSHKIIVKLSKEDIINIYPDTIESIKRAIDHFRDSYQILTSELLPYPALIVMFSYFYYKNKEDPTEKQDTYLKEYFWRSALTSRFTSAVESKLTIDRKIIEEIMDDKKPIFGNEFKVNITANEIKNLEFKINAVNKAILCMLVHHQPRSFKNHKRVKIHNSWLSKSNSKNYHHFFPKGFIKDHKLKNSIANITIVDEELNQRKIKALKPSIYMKEFQKSNKKLSETMKTHLIDDLNEFGIWDDNYDKFLKKRSYRIYEELKKIFNPNNE